MNSSKVVKLNPREIEPHWQKIWEEQKLFSPDLDKAKKPFYNLMMFPYPSAEGLHVGNMYAFTGVDVYGRFQRMKGKDVFEPIGLDGFGIHSENYALKVNRHPKEQAKISEKNFYRQLRATGNAYDWTRTVETYDPNYYKWTQWLFIQMFKAGLAYKGEAEVNWCPSCLTVLADEQVIDGRCERCKTLVRQKKLNQWFFRIATGKRPDGSTYPDSLLKNLDHIDWVEKVKVGQRNWIGRKEGINIKYQIERLERVRPSGSSRSDPEYNEYIECFTTRPDTNFGATFIVVGPEHPFVEKILSEGPEEIKAYVEAAKKKTPEERIAEGARKTGVFTGFYAINDLNGKEMPIWISDFVLGDVGTGAVVGVPGHDKRDFQFAKKFDIPIIRVVVGADGDTSPITREEQVQEEEGTMVNSEFLNGLDIREATKKIMDYLEEKGWGKRVVHYHLRDWLISRQRYWGAPIPMIYCGKCADEGISWFTSKNAIEKEKLEMRDEKWEEEVGSENASNQDTPLHYPASHFTPRTSMPGWSAQRTDSQAQLGWFPVPEDQLPVLLPDVTDWKPTGTGKAPLASVPEFVKTTCPNCGGEAERETDVCDTFLDSSWYFLRYPSTPRQPAGRSVQVPFDPEITKKWLPVNIYIGGAEHTVLHLLYARFVTMALKDMGYLDFEEPFTQFYAHGLIIKEGAKMSKSRGNVVVPDDYIAAYGADALRTYLMFLGGFDQGGDFRDTGIAGMYRFVARVWRLVNQYLNQESGIRNQEATRHLRGGEAATSTGDLLRTMHSTIKEVTEDMENLRYNTAIAHIMEYVNAMSNVNPPAGGQMSNLPEEAIKNLLLLLAPFMPHITEELWQRLESRIKNQESREEKNHNLLFIIHNSIHFHPWPVYDPKMIEEDEVEIVVQVNGKLRETLKMSKAKAQMANEVESKARDLPKVQRQLAGKTTRNIIFVPGKLINFVVN